MPNIENRLRRVEALPGHREKETILIRWTIINPPPRDADDKIIGPATVHGGVEWPEIHL